MTVTFLLVVAATATALGFRTNGVSSSSAAAERRLEAAWPVSGEAALTIAGTGVVRGREVDRVVPIASVAKVMTAYVVLRDHPLAPGEAGPAFRIGASDVSSYRKGLAGGESVLKVREGETLSERQALQALLLPSANNIARLLARWDAGSVPAFVAKMNSAAAELGMRRTRYTDPSGLDSATVSSAADQLILASRAMAIQTFAAIVALPRVWLPVAGNVLNYNAAAGRDGFIGIKTGSDSAAGGCWLFAAIRRIGGQKRTVHGVVLGQYGGAEGLVGAALAAGRRLAAAAPALWRVTHDSPQRGS